MESLRDIARLEFLRDIAHGLVVNEQLPARVQAAIDSIGGPHDLRLRTTIRRDDVDVWTSFLLVCNYYETMLRGGNDVYRLMALAGKPCDIRTDTRADAEAAHAAMCATVEAVLRGAR
jgi:hypothetical protein